MSDWNETIEYLADRMSWPAGDTGVSSNAMVREAIGGGPPGPRERPWDDADMHRCYLAYDRAPAHLQRRMLPRLKQFRDALREDLSATKGAA